MGKRLLFLSVIQVLLFVSGFTQTQSGFYLPQGRSYPWLSSQGVFGSTSPDGFFTGNENPALFMLSKKPSFLVSWGVRQDIPDGWFLGTDVSFTFWTLPGLIQFSWPFQTFTTGLSFYESNQSVLDTYDANYFIAEPNGYEKIKDRELRRTLDFSLAADLTKLGFGSAKQTLYGGVSIRYHFSSFSYDTPYLFKKGESEEVTFAIGIWGNLTKDISAGVHFVRNPTIESTLSIESTGADPRMGEGLYVQNSDSVTILYLKNEFKTKIADELTGSLQFLLPAGLYLNARYTHIFDDQFGNNVTFSYDSQISVSKQVLDSFQPSIGLWLNDRLYKKETADALEIDDQLRAVLLTVGTSYLYGPFAMDLVLVTDTGLSGAFR